jgi:hypothetical protein
MPFIAPHSHSFTVSLGPELEKVLQVHKCDPLNYRRPVEKPLGASQQQDDLLISSFAYLRLQPAQPLVTSLICMCGHTFTSQEALEKHKAEKRQLTRSKVGEGIQKTFKTPRPQYQEDDYLRDNCAALARRNDIVEKG